MTFASAMEVGRVWRLLRDNALQVSRLRKTRATRRVQRVDKIQSQPQPRELGSCTWPMALNNEKDNISLRSKGSCQDLVAHFCQKKLVSFVSSNCRQSIIHINEYGSIEDEGKSFILKHKRVTNPVFYDIQTANHVDHEGKQLY